MKKSLIVLAVMALLPFVCEAQNALNSNPDSVVGVFYVPGENDSKVEFTKNADGSYDGAVIWMKSPIDPSTGKVWCDVKNPDRSLRGRSCMGLKVIEGLKYDPAKKCWGGTKIYDPNRGIRANVRINFTADGRLCIKGTVLGIGETVYWKRTDR